MRHKTTITLLGAFLATSTILAAESKGQFIDANTYETVVQGKSSGKGSPAMQESQCAQGALLTAQQAAIRAAKPAKGPDAATVIPPT